MAYYSKGDNVLVQVEGPYKPRRGLWAAGVVVATDLPGQWPYKVRLHRLYEYNHEWFFSSRSMVQDTLRNRRTRRVRKEDQ
jgi:hypothetical protein